MIHVCVWMCVYDEALSVSKEGQEYDRRDRLQNAAN